MRADAFLTLLHGAVVLGVLLGSIRLISENKHSVSVVFYAFGLASVLLSDLYWLAYELLRPGTRMPFAANEIGEWAMFLLAGACLTARRTSFYRSAGYELIGVGVFAAANVGLWIAWSGEWVQDILTGLAFGYALCCLVARIRQEDAFAPRDWLIFGIACPVLIFLQVLIFFVPQQMKQPLDVCCYVLLFAGVAYLLGCAVHTMRENRSLRKETEEKTTDDSKTHRGKGEAGRELCRLFAVFSWVVITMYMSEGVYYIVATLLSLFCYPMILMALKKEVETA